MVSRRFTISWRRTSLYAASSFIDPSPTIAFPDPASPAFILADQYPGPPERHVREWRTPVPVPQVGADSPAFPTATPVPNRRAPETGPRVRTNSSPGDSRPSAPLVRRRRAARDRTGGGPADRRRRILLAQYREKNARRAPRTTIVGDAIARILDFAGHHVRGSGPGPDVTATSKRPARSQALPRKRRRPSQDGRACWLV